MGGMIQGRYRTVIRQQAGVGFIESMLAMTIFAGILTGLITTFVIIGKVYLKNTSEAKTQQVARNIVDSLSEAIQSSGGVVKGLRCSKVTDGTNVDLPPLAGGRLRDANHVDRFSPCPLANPYPDSHYTGAYRGYWGGYCIGDVGYVYRLGKQLKQGGLNNPLAEGSFLRLRTCNPSDSAWQNLQNNLSGSPRSPRNRAVTELLQPQMRVAALNMINTMTTPETINDDKLWLIDVTVALGGNDDDSDHDTEVFAREVDRRWNPVTSLDQDYQKIVGCNVRQSFCAVSRLRTTAYKQFIINHTSPGWYYLRGHEVAYNQ